MEASRKWELVGMAGYGWWWSILPPKQQKKHKREVEAKHRGFDWAITFFVLSVEAVAVISGEKWLAIAAACCLWFAFWEYSKERLSSWSRLSRWAVRGVIALVLAFLSYRAMNKMQDVIYARLFTFPKVNFSVTNDRILVLDNSKGDLLTDFKINGSVFELDKAEITKNHAKIQDYDFVGGDLDFYHFDLQPKEIKKINLKEDRYGVLLLMGQPAPPMDVFDRFSRYVCLRIEFTKDDTQEKFVHYMVISPYSGGGDFGEHPDDVGSPKNEEGFPFTIQRIIKAAARNYYGTETREYKP